ncbi:hypothetical protein ABZ154_34585 [Streptomyces sp. NPDC006261]|uniref:hypothetical protein n=1 Tax=Streptomyces sp. NPDC006261 TaxID=3156739 RepID=UPI0033AD2A4B
MPPPILLAAEKQRLDPAKVCIPGYTLLRLGPYFQTWVASHDADHLNTELAGQAATVLPGFTVTAKRTRCSTSTTTTATPTRTSPTSPRSSPTPSRG